MKKFSSQYFVFCLYLCSGMGAAQAFDVVYEAASDAIYAHPHDLVLSADQRFLYVADNGNDRVAVLDPASLKLLGSFGQGDLSEPHDVVFDSAGRLLVADTGGSRIAIYEVERGNGKLIGELSASIRRPEGVDVHPNGRIYATGAASDNVVAYDDGRVVNQLGGFSGPHDVRAAPDGSLWIADAGNDRLVNVTQELEMIRVLQGEAYQFNGPRYLDFDQAGRLYVADKYTNQIKVLAPDLSLLLTLGEHQKTEGPGHFNRPEGIAIQGNRVWFSDTYNDRIVRYRMVE